MAQTFPSANLTLQLRDLELAPEMQNFRPSAQLQSHLGETTWVGPVLKNLPGFLFVLKIKEALVGCVLSWVPNQMGVRGSL